MNVISLLWKTLQIFYFIFRLIRNIENKLINCQLDVVFNETSLNEDILTIYTNICIYVYIYTALISVELS